MEQLRLVETPSGPITYVLIRKRIKNLNLRVGRKGQAVLSVPDRCSLAYADSFIREKSAWILRAARRQTQTAPDLPPLPPKGECRRLLQQALDRVFPLVEPLGITYPELKLRRMKTQWGNCHWHQDYITLNTALARCPEYLRDYVALHELVHFLHPNHGPGFYAAMDKLMPNWREYRKQLKEYASALET